MVQESEASAIDVPMKAACRALARKGIDPARGGLAPTTMNHRGHPKNPIRRADLQLDRLATSFIVECTEEAPELARHLGALNADGIRSLGGVLARFDARGRGELDAQERLLARRVINRLQRPGTDSLTLLNKVLDYLDLNMNALLDEDELELCLRVMDLFSRMEGNADTLTTRELQSLYAVLRHLDRDGNGQLDPLERFELKQGLVNPEAFLAEQREFNPHLQRVLAEV